MAAKKLTLKDIKDGKLIGKPEKVTVQIKIGEDDAEFETFIRPFSYDTAVAHLKAYGEQKEALAGILASCICDETGRPEFTEDEVRSKFSQALVDALWNKVVELNMLGKSQNLAKKTKSSSKSQSQQVEPSPKSDNLTTEKSSNGQPTSSNEAALMLGAD